MPQICRCEHCQLRYIGEGALCGSCLEKTLAVEVAAVEQPQPARRRRVTKAKTPAQKKELEINIVANTWITLPVFKSYQPYVPNYYRRHNERM